MSFQQTTEAQPMKIYWNRVVIAGILSELLLLVIRVPFLRYDGPAPWAVNLLTHFIPLFLGGLWIARKIESRLVLHGVLVGVVANLLLIVLAPLLMLLKEPSNQQLTSLLISIPVKIAGSTLGGYIGGKLRKKALE
jgi:putative membrane protein (TIGR04086 family)